MQIKDDNMKRLIGFDLDNTIINYEYTFREASKAAFCRVFHPTLLHKWFPHYKWQCDRYWSDYEQQRMTRAEYREIRFQKSLHAAGLTWTMELQRQFDGYVDCFIPQYVQPISGMIELIADIAQREEVAILTNGFIPLQRGKLLTIDLFRYVDERNVYISEAVGIAKPKVEFFRHVEQQIAAREYWMIGDSWKLDIEGATAAGWKTIYFHSQQPLQLLKDGHWASEAAHIRNILQLS